MRGRMPPWKRVITLSSLERNATAQAPAVSVCAVVVTYNRKQLLLQCIEHLRASRLANPNVRFDVLVVDNASTDGTRQALDAALEQGTGQGKVAYFNTGANLGGAGGFSIGMEKAISEGYDYLWVMDDDCLVQPDALQALLDAADSLGGANGPWGFLSSVVHWTDGSICQMNVQRHPLFSDITDFSAPLQPCTLASFVSLFVPTARVRELGLPIAEFFIWTDDWEFTRRLSRAYPCYVVGASRVTHASANNGAGNIYTDVPERLDRYRYIYRNDVVLYREEGLKGRAFLAARALYHMFRVLASPVGAKGKRIAIIARSNLDGVHFRPAITYPQVANPSERSS